MSIKVIEHGKYYHEIECPNCKARIGYTNKEVDKRTDCSYNNWSIHKYIQCPECDEKITLELNIDGKIVDDGISIHRFKVNENSTIELV